MYQVAGAGGASGENLSLGMTSAAVGQIAKISAVDANGVPTAWEPVDMPPSGDNETNFQLVFNNECLLDAGVSAYESILTLAFRILKNLLR